MNILIFDAVRGKSRTLDQHVRKVREAITYARGSTRMEPEVVRLIGCMRHAADKYDDGATKDWINDKATCLEKGAR